MSWLCIAPSNIAVVKYMGKQDVAGNVPTNSSLSMTLSKLATWLTIEPSPTGEWAWHPKPLSEWTQFQARIEKNKRHVSQSVHAPEFLPIHLDEKEKERMRSFFYLAQDELTAPLRELGFKTREPAGNRGWQLSSVNTFPASSGIASSASSFAALTLAAFVSSIEQGRSELVLTPDLRRILADLSRRGSGSSCRSFFGPWVSWELEVTHHLKGSTSVSALESKLPPMTDLVVVLSKEKKQVGSSAAHQRVRSSPLWQGRVERVEARHLEIRECLRASDLKRLSLIAWQEAWEMHSLFHTASPPFTYWAEKTMTLLRFFQNELAKPDLNFGYPIVTLDAGPNVHVIVESAKALAWCARLREVLGEVEILVDEQGTGPMIWSPESLG
jgi:diphosphomevalonate decarboxylase